MATDFVPGSNLAGVSADWRFLLPSLHLNNTLLLGTPSIASLSVLSAISRRVYVLSTDPLQLLELQRVAQQRDIRNLQVILVESFGDLPFSRHSMALIWLTGGRRSPNPLRSPCFVTELDRVLDTEGVVYFEESGRLTRIFNHRVIKAASRHNFGSPQIFWLTSRGGEMSTAVPLGHREIDRHIFADSLYGRSRKTRALSRIGERLARLGLLRYIMLRLGVLIPRPKVSGGLEHPPQYLVSIAEKAGINLASHSCSFSARSGDRSSKVILYSFKESNKVPDIVVKVVRVPQFNHKLEHEHRMLSLLKEKSFVDTHSFPEPLFIAHHENLAVCGQKAVHGHPFLRRTKGNASCPLAHAAIDWIIQLGSSSADHGAATPDEISASLSRLFTRFIEIYTLSEREKTFLREQIEELGRARSRIPLVFQHGDADPCNVVTTGSKEVAFLDWETSELHGVPLWDLFSFVRGFGRWISRSRGNHDDLDSFAQHFLSTSPMRRFLNDASKRYCESVGLESALVEPLFYTCWMYRALKQCRLLATGTLQSGYYFRLLRLCITQRSTLFGADLQGAGAFGNTFRSGWGVSRSVPRCAGQS